MLVLQATLLAMADGETVALGPVRQNLSTSQGLHQWLATQVALETSWVADLHFPTVCPSGQAIEDASVGNRPMRW